VPDVWYQARKKVGDIKHTLPAGVQGPFLDDEYGDVYSAIYALTGSEYSPAELKRIAEDARQRLLRVKDVDKVVLVGDRSEKVFVEFSHHKLATLGVSPQRVFDSLARQNAVAPAGSVETRTDLPRGRVLPLEFGPPVGFPVNFRVVGPDPVTVRRIAKQVRDVMRQDTGVRDAQLEWDEPAKVVRLKVDQDRARALGLAPQDVASTLQTLLSGTAVTQYREGTELIDVVARAVPEERLNLDTLPDLTLIAPAGHAVPLSQVATLAYEQEEPILWRRNRDTVLTVRADVTPGVQPPDVSGRILPKLADIKASGSGKFFWRYRPWWVRIGVSTPQPLSEKHHGTDA